MSSAKRRKSEMSGSTNEASVSDRVDSTKLTLTVSNASSSSEFVSSLYHDHASSDLILVNGCNNKEYHVHRLIMSQSPVLKTMLYSTQWSESNKNRVVLNEQPDYIDGLQQLISYLYNQPVDISMNNIASIVYIADKYSVDALLEQCVEYFLTQVEQFGDLCAAINACKLVRSLLNTEDRRLSRIRSLLLANVEMVFSDESALVLIDFDDIKSILESDAVACRTEFTLYKLLENWLMLIQDQAERVTYYRELVPKVRVQYMHVQELSYLERSPMRLFLTQAVQQEATSLMKIVLCDAYKFHLVSKADWNPIHSPISRHYIDMGTCMTFTLLDTYSLASWAKVEQFFEVKGSLSKADDAHISFRVTLMRKMTACLVGPERKQKESAKSILCLEITQLTCYSLRQTEAAIYVQTRKGPRTLRKHLCTLQLNTGNSKLAQSDILNYDEIAGKESIYRHSNGNQNVYLMLEIILQ